MADTKAEPGAGDVPITLDNDELVLKPSLECCMAVSKLAGNSLVMAIQRCERLDFEFICEVLCHGLGATSPALRKEVQAKVFKQGVISVAADTILFIRVIMNGGQHPVDDEEDGDEPDRPLATPSPSGNSTDA